MAIVARYRFSSSEEASRAAEAVKYECGSSSAWCNGDIVEIYADCSNPSLAAQICRAHGGAPY